MMTSLTSRAEWTPVAEAGNDWVQVMQKFPHKPALVVFDSYYFSTASLNRLNPSISSTDSHSPAPVARTNFIGAVKKD